MFDFLYLVATEIWHKLFIIVRLYFQVLNEYFHNVCELDLVFNFYKVYTIVDEMFLAGELRETSQTKVLKQLLMLNSLE